ncbi:MULTISPECIES: hypothetical protein [unclassified Enterococcus]|uniref:hypothetical protein n=1 Tax=unclassified Enterococcus TaxID=2608891 RepID=UPI001552B43C|nr:MULTISPECIES: hypothetical protein [unclassified Enterococcus]MBS7576317.1 hypothetical protein [Enterococcus sp. MMGLQ5-2]MBS7583550.1 hypothetical protein [Enterococcus sp. MMGLQ5-1]NPD11412.1 hypothetical protein [Enterococcus sp. MMGLQ5-1]NPD36155.1 hypothetical protein [Enterococcus sp. MMGLQ5-2]
MNKNNIEITIIELLKKSIEKAKQLSYNQLELLLSNSLTQIKNSDVKNVVPELNETLMLYLAAHPSHGFNEISQLIKILGSYSGSINYGKWSGLGQLGYH